MREALGNHSRIAIAPETHYLVNLRERLADPAAPLEDPRLLATVQDQFPNNRALGNGTFLALNFLIRALGIWVVGRFSDAFGLNAAFTMTAVLAFISVPAVFFLPGERLKTT